MAAKTMVLKGIKVLLVPWIYIRGLCFYVTLLLSSALIGLLETHRTLQIDYSGKVCVRSSFCDGIAAIKKPSSLCPKDRIEHLITLSPQVT